MDFTSAEGRQRYDALVAAAASTVVGLDFDGTLAPIVDDPETAHIHPDAPGVLLALAGVVRAVAVITGRPARKALALGGLDEVGREIGETGRELFVFGQYGYERWSSTQRRVVSPRPPQGLSAFLRDLPRVLREADAADAFIEDKGLAIAAHTRRLDDPAGAYDRLLPRLTELSERHGLVVEPGRNVIEMRSPGMDKGVVVRNLAEEVEAGGFLFAGDDLGDVEAFEAVAELRRQGLPTLLVCSASQEESTLLELSDVVVPGPEGVLGLLRQLTEDATRG
ncbi:trehalose-phosphatase [Nocardioides cynanchi]|uniref:trehalose-phosphatase n=1 Tax=Nocardioides cynanchi TaxID=2558918 RepID=UPI00124710BD|nr:trehalose-phosphatase [Nocardioides cynanchi]